MANKVSEAELKSFAKTLQRISKTETASERVRSQSIIALSVINSLHGCLCSDHLPYDQYAKTEVEFDLSKDLGRKLI